MSKLSDFTGRVLSANGPAQILSYSFWGILVSGMLFNGNLPHGLLCFWGTLSALVVVSAIWWSKRCTVALLVADMTVSALVLCLYVMADPVYVTTMVYNVMADGTFIKHNYDITRWFTCAMLVWMTLHSAYLANLLQRQELESRRFRNDS